MDSCLREKQVTGIGIQWNVPRLRDRVGFFSYVDPEVCMAICVLFIWFSWNCVVCIMVDQSKLFLYSPAYSLYVQAYSGDVIVKKILVLFSSRLIVLLARIPRLVQKKRSISWVAASQRNPSLPSHGNLYYQSHLSGL